jgi:hypothetical protein
MQTTFARSLRCPSGSKSEHPTTNSQHLKITVAIFHLSVKTVSRSAGRSSTAAAAYRAGAEITDERTGEIHDYRRKSGVESAELFLPAGAPEWATDRAKLWNAAEQSETRKNSTVAREFEVALPAELSADQRRELAHEFTAALVKKYEFAADCAIHLPGKNGDSQNHHAHILCSTRKLTAEGFTAKTRELDDRATGAAHVVECRELFANMTNAALERAGHAVRVDHRSLEAQGIDRDAGIHLGPSATAIERRGEVSEKTQHHQERQAEAAGKVAALVVIAEAQARATAEIKEKENDRIRAAALGALKKSSRSTDRAHAFTVADHGGIADNLRAASGDLGRAVKGAERRVSERHYGRVVEAVRGQFERVGGVVQQVADRVGSVVRTVATAALQIVRKDKLERARKQAVKPARAPVEAAKPETKVITSMQAESPPKRPYDPRAEAEQAAARKEEAQAVVNRQAIAHGITGMVPFPPGTSGLFTAAHHSSFDTALNKAEMALKFYKPAIPRPEKSIFGGSGKQQAWDVQQAVEHAALEAKVRMVVDAIQWRKQALKSTLQALQTRDATQIAEHAQLAQDFAKQKQLTPIQAKPIGRTRRGSGMSR